MKKRIALFAAVLMIIQSAFVAVPAAAADTITLAPCADEDAEVLVAAPKAPKDVVGIVINQDAAELLAAGAEVTSVEQIKAFANQFAGTHVKEYILAVNNNIASFPSNSWTDVLDKYAQKTENGVDVDYTNNFRGANNLFNTLGIDIFDVLGDAFEEIGIDYWLSFRINSADGTTNATSNLLSDFFHNNPSARRVTHNSISDPAYHNNYDFANEAVRENFLNLINDALSRYDVNGIEIDFQHDIWLWKIGEEYLGLDIMNEFMAEIDALVNRYEADYGHPIKLSVRVAKNVEANMEFGLDVMSWVADGIVDRVSPSGRPGVTDNEIPVRLWNSLLDPFGVEVAPVVDSGYLVGTKTYALPQTYETFAANASNFLAQDADIIYLSGMTRSSFTNLIDESDKVSAISSDSYDYTDAFYWKLINTIGCLPATLSVNRKFILTYSDNRQIWIESVDIDQLPATLNAEDGVAFRIPLNSIPADAKVTLKMSTTAGASGEDKAPIVHVNSEKCTYLRTIPGDNGRHTSRYISCYDIPVEAHDEGHMLIDLIATSKIKVDYVEIYVEPSQSSKIGSVCGQSDITNPA